MTRNAIAPLAILIPLVLVGSHVLLIIGGYQGDRAIISTHVALN